MAERITDRGIGARGLQSELVKVLKEPLYHLPDKKDVCEYRVDYRDEIVVDEIVGNRIRTQPRTPAERMVMDQSDRENLGVVSIDYVREDDVSIHLFVDEMFEPFATKSFMGNNGPGLNDCYDYLTIKQAQIFTAAAVIHLFIETKRNKKHKDMCSLLSVIRKMPASTTKQTVHPFEKVKNRLLVKLEDCDSDRIKEIRKISWNVARSYGLLLYKLDYEHLIEIIDIAKKKHLKLILGTFEVDCTGDTLDPMVEGMVKMMGVFAELERNMISERVTSGMRNAAAKGKVIGRPHTTVANIPQRFMKSYPLYEKHKINQSELARITGLNRGTVRKYIKMLEEKKDEVLGN